MRIKKINSKYRLYKQKDGPKLALVASYRLPCTTERGYTT